MVAAIVLSDTNVSGIGMVLYSKVQILDVHFTHKFVNGNVNVKQITNL
jgi:hypothetical protein